MSLTALCPFVIIFGRTSFYYKLNTVEIGELAWNSELQWLHFLDILDPKEYNFSCNWWCVDIRAKQKTIQSEKEAKNYFILEQQFIPSIEMQSINLRNQINLNFLFKGNTVYPRLHFANKICKKTFHIILSISAWKKKLESWRGERLLEGGGALNHGYTLYTIL